jgi:hypothetical protein
MTGIFSSLMKLSTQPGEATLKLHHFGEALSWATRNGVLVEEFIKLHELVNDLNKELHESDKKVYCRSSSERLEVGKYDYV